MRIGLQTWGSHGDIRPMLALANGLHAKGHTVTLSITSVGEARYGDAPNSAITIREIASPVISDVETLSRLEQDIFSETDPVAQVRNILKNLFVPVEADMYRESERLCQENDLVIGHFFHYPLRIAAEKNHCPHASLTLVHSILPTSFRPPAGFPNLGKISNMLAWRLARFILNRKIKPFPDRLRQAQGLLPARDMLADVWISDRLNLIAVSPELCPPQPDWPKQNQVCGFLDIKGLTMEGDVPDDLNTFIDAESPPVYITLGSAMTPNMASQKATLTILAEAARRAGARAIIQSPDWRACGFTNSKDFHFVTSAPHDRVFPRCRAIVHHGGAGTTHSALAAGVPSIVVAHIAEQVFWGRELARLGVSPGLLHRQNMTPEKLAEYIKTAIHSKEQHVAATHLRHNLKAEKGVETAICMIEHAFAHM